MANCQIKFLYTDHSSRTIDYTRGADLSNLRESPEMVHDLQVSRQCYTISLNVGRLIDLLFSATKHAFCVNPRGFGATPRDADHRGLKLAKFVFATGSHAVLG